MNFKDYGTTIWCFLIVFGVLLTSHAYIVHSQSPPRLTAPLDGAEVIRMGSDINRVVLGKQDIARVNVINTRELLVFGEKSGATSLHIWTDGGLREYVLKVEQIPSQQLDQQNKNVLRAVGEVGPDGKELRVFTPEYRDVSEFEQYIQQLLQDDGEILLADEQAGKLFVYGPTSLLDKIDSLLNRLDVPTEESMYTQRINIENRPVKEIAEKVKQMTSDEGQVIIDEETNSLLLIDKVDKVKSIQDYIKGIDVRTVSQVRIEAKFVETEDNKFRDLGIDWSYNGTLNTEQLTSNFTPSLAGSDLTVGLTSSGGNGLNATLRALEEEGKVNFISSPNVVTRNQQKALIEVINEQTYVAGCNSTVQGQDVVSVTPQIETITDGITLNVTPLIGKN
ncbi:MAG: secretin N-terminal domain-containing protein, partial [bacterium]